MSRAEPLVAGGHSGEFWLALFALTHRPSSQGPVQWCTADGRPQWRQPQPLQQAFAVIRGEAQSLLQQARGGEHGR